jgi:hypothetical protein
MGMPRKPLGMRVPRGYARAISGGNVDAPPDPLQRNRSGGYRLPRLACQWCGQTVAHWLNGQRPRLHKTPYGHDCPPPIDDDAFDDECETGFVPAEDVTGLSRARREERIAAYREFCWALKYGLLSRPHVCQECGHRPARSGAIHAHHRDYAKPLDVEWLCRGCHARRQRAALMEYDIPEAARERARREGRPLHQIAIELLGRWASRATDST